MVQATAIYNTADYSSSTHAVRSLRFNSSKLAWATGGFTVAVGAGGSLHMHNTTAKEACSTDSVVVYSCITFPLRPRPGRSTTTHDTRHTTCTPAPPAGGLHRSNTRRPFQHAVRSRTTQTGDASSSQVASSSQPDGTLSHVPTSTVVVRSSVPPFLRSSFSPGVQRCATQLHQALRPKIQAPNPSLVDGDAGTGSLPPRRTGPAGGRLVCDVG